MVLRADDLIAEADILTTDVTGGEVRAQLGEATDGTGVANDVSMFGVDGFVSRPNDSDQRGAAQAYYLAEGHQRIILGTRDNRFAPQVGALKPGDRAIVTDGPTRFLMKKDTQLVSLYSEAQNRETSKSMMLSIDGSTGIFKLSNGDAYIEMRGDEILIGINGGAQLSIKAGAFKFMGQSFAAACASGSLGVVGGAPPLPGINGIIYGVSGVTGVPSTSWTVAAV